MSDQRADDGALPDPLVGAHVDLSSYRGFIVDVRRLMASETVAKGTPEQLWAAFLLWCQAFEQKPCGSLPDDERALANFSGAGRRWKHVRAIALRGWVKCSDARLYHRFLSAVINDAWAGKNKKSQAGKKGADSRWQAAAERAGDDATALRSHAENDATALRSDMRSQCKVEVEEEIGQESGIGKDKKSEPAAAAPGPDPESERARRAPPAAEVPEVWYDGWELSRTVVEACAVLGFTDQARLQQWVPEFRIYAKKRRRTREELDHSFVKFVKFERDDAAKLAARIASLGPPAGPRAVNTPAHVEAKLRAHREANLALFAIPEEYDAYIQDVDLRGCFS